MRKTLSLFLCLALLFAAVPAAAADDVCFISTNDSLEQLTYQPYFSGSTAYVPISVFANFKIYNTYHYSSSTASLYSSSKQLYFDMETGETYDGQGNYYNVTPIWRGGAVYVPVDFVCQQYGLAWSYIQGNGYGDVLRIVDSDVHLTDAQFLTAAKQLMSSRYNAYVGNTNSEDIPIPGVDIASDCVVWLSFVGLPSSRLLDILGEYGVKAGFFLTAGELRDNTATVRRIVGEGHSIGVLCYGDPLAEYLEFRALLYEAAHTATVLIASGGDAYDELCRQAALENDLVFWDYDNDCIQDGAGLSYASLVTAYLEYRPERLDTRALCTELTDATLPSVLSYITENNITVRAPNEVGAPSYD